MSEGQRAAFDALMGELPGREGVRREVKYGTPLGVIRELCRGDAATGAHVVLTTARMPLSLARECVRHGVDAIAEVELARSALTLAVRSGSTLTRLTRLQVYQALARDVPDQDEFRRNVSIRWSDIDRSLPPQDIRFQLPPRDDGMRLLFDSFVLDVGCRREKLVEQIYNAQQRTTRCVTTRTDRVREIARDQAVKALLDAPEGTIGVLAYPDVASSGGNLVGLTLDGAPPSRDAILDQSYDVVGSLWLYARRDANQPASLDDAIERLLIQAQSDEVAGPEGLLPRLGFFPLSPDEREAQRSELSSVTRDLGVSSLLGWATSSVGSALRLTGVWSSTASGTKGGTDFTSLMELAGYTLKSVDSSVGVIPSAGTTFGIVREMSDADREYLVRALTRDQRQRLGILPAIQRRIIRTVLDASATSGFVVSSVQISFLPLPGVDLVISPTPP